jgi:lactate dehydrogenase-like 2-hydroxyacid dehydrogenase
MRERTPITASLLERLLRLKLIASTGSGNASIDLAAAVERGIAVAHTSYAPTPAIELTWALILVSARHIASEATSVCNGGWQLIRITPADKRTSDAHPELDTLEIDMANGVGPKAARNVVGGDFLHLVRLGLRDPHDPLVRDTSEVIDAVLRRDLHEAHEARTRITYFQM